MKIAMFSTKSYDEVSFCKANEISGHRVTFLKPQLELETARLAQGFEAVCIFVNDILSRPVLEQLKDNGVRFIAIRASGYNNVDLQAARDLEFTVVRVPAYSPEAVAEHTMALILALNRKIHKAHQRVREGNFSLEGLLGFNLHEKTVGVIGTGRIGEAMIKILTGFGCKVIALDRRENPVCLASGAKYTSLDELLALSDIITLHCPLLAETKYIINEQNIAKMKTGVMLINTSRGGLIDTKAVIRGLKKGQVGYLGLDVYEEEGDLFFEDLSGTVISDDVFARLTTFPNVIITGHQAFFTDTALQTIAEVTLSNCTEFEKTGNCANAIK
ncbi:MAG: 2-hydroxyacid dehydrogenase [Deltaproteobacteria bacterium]|nr:2-hydroxyacid dehydrogenase [Deltaproteobacteria bacterium]